MGIAVHSCEAPSVSLLCAKSGEIILEIQPQGTPVDAFFRDQSHKPYVLMLLWCEMEVAIFRPNSPDLLENKWDDGKNTEGGNSMQ